jgi:hypothetical protein
MSFGASWFGIYGAGSVADYKQNLMPPF